MALPEVKLKKATAIIPPSTILPERIEKAKVMNTGERDDIKNIDVGPRILRFLETPVTVVELENGGSGTSSGSPLKRRREG